MEVAPSGLSGPPLVQQPMPPVSKMADVGTLQYKLQIEARYPLHQSYKRTICLVFQANTKNDTFLVDLDHAWNRTANHPTPTFANSLHKVDGMVSQVLVFIYCL